MKRIRLFLFAAGCCILAGCGWFGFGGAADVREEKTMDGKAVDEVFIEAAASDIEVIPASGTDLVVSLEGQIDEKMVDRYQWTVKQENYKLQVKYLLKKGKVGLRTGSDKDVNLIVKLPEKLYDSLQVKGSSGDIAVKKVHTKHMEIETESGDQTMNDVIIHEQLALASSSGSLSLKHNEANKAKLFTESGNIQSTGMQADHLTASTSSGDISVSAESMEGNMKLASTSGDILVQSNQQPDSLKVDFLSHSGKAHLPENYFTIKEKTENSLLGEIGKKKYLLNARTESGDFSFKFF